MNYAMDCIKSTATYTNTQCTFATNTFELLANVNPHLSVIPQNNQLELWLPAQLQIIANIEKAFQIAICEFTNKYADVFPKPSKPIAYDITHHIELLNPAWKIQYYQ